MNRYLAIPLCLSVVGFVAVLTSRTSLGDPAPDYAPAAYRPATGATPMLSYDQTRTFVLDQWPIASRNLIGSRAMPRSSFHATLERMASRELNVGDVDDATSFLCTLRIDAEVFPDWRQLVTYPESARAESQPDDSLLGVNHFPIHVDRTTQAIHIFADQKWQPYSQWRDGNLAKLKRLTNWSR